MSGLDPLTRALRALDDLRPSESAPAALPSWEEARNAIMDARAHYRTALVVAVVADALCHLLERLELVADDGSARRQEITEAVRLSRINLQEALAALKRAESS